jgi:hypothetical protein
MGNRVLIGKRGSDYGLFVSQSGVDVTSGSAALAWDSRAVAGLNVHSYGQGILASDDQNFTYSGTTYTAHEIDITHNLGYKPAFAVRWCTDAEISSGVATKVWSPNQAWAWEEKGDCDGYDEGEECTEHETGIGCYTNLTTSILNIENVSMSTDDGDPHTPYLYPMFYSYIIFTAENFLGGESL